MDALNRRSRFASPIPFFKEPDFDANIDIFKAINRHGPLPAPYLTLLDRRKNHYNMQRRLTRLYNGYCPHPDHDAKFKDGHKCKSVVFLTRNPKQWKTIHARYQPAVYGLSDYAYHELKKRGEACRPFTRSNSFLHDLGLSCFTASFELQSRRFKFRDELVEHPFFKGDEKDPFVFHINKEVRPDDILANEYDDGVARFFALEWDAGTESPEKTIAKLRDYQEIIRSGAFKTIVPNLTILYPTVREAKARKIMTLINEQVDEKYRGRFLTKVFPNFADPFRVPKEPLDVMTDWLDFEGGLHDITKKAAA